ncbi:MAG: hypothetical protein ACP5JJ_16815, partial [Anaerolineae bacterium]
CSPSLIAKPARTYEHIVGTRRRLRLFPEQKLNPYDWEARTMFDRFAAEIHIGGPIPRTLIEPLAEAIVATGASLLGYGDKIATKQEALEALRDGTKVSLYDDQALCGRMADLEDFLLKHHIHFDHCSVAYGEYDAEMAFYRGGPEAVYIYATQDGRPLFSQEELAGILDHPQWSDSQKLEALGRLIHPPEMHPLQPLQLI